MFHFTCNHGLNQYYGNCAAIYQSSNSGPTMVTTVTMVTIPKWQQQSVSASAAELLDVKQESRANARKPHDAAAVYCGLKFTDIHYKFKDKTSSESQASEL